MSGWFEFTLAYLVFLAAHAFPIRPPIKPFLVARLGRRGFSLAYSALSLGLLVWLIVAAGRAPYVEIWPRALWQNHVTLTAMTVACLILCFAAFRPNPLSFGGFRNADFDPAWSGIVGWIRHPLLAVLALWAAGHTVPNGDLAHVLMFGGFALFAVLGMVMIDRRKRRELGAARWRELVQAARAGHNLTPGAGTLLRVAAAVALLAALITLHPHVIGLEAIAW